MQNKSAVLSLFSAVEMPRSVKAGRFRIGCKDRLVDDNMLGVQAMSEVGETGRARAFASFYRAEYGAVLAYAVRRIDDEETAREVAADVFRIAWARFDERPNRAWLFNVARNRVGDAYRSRDRDRRLIETLAAEPSQNETSDDGRIDQVLAALPAPAREVLRLTYWEDLSADEAGQVLGCSAAAVWVRLHRARRAFQKLWTEQGR